MTRTMTGLRRPSIGALVTVSLLAGCGAPSTVPPGDGAPTRIVDYIDLLEPPLRQRIDAYLLFVRNEYGIDYRVVLAPALDDESILSAANRHFRRLGVGEGVGGRGLLLYVAPGGAEVRVEVGYALEPFVTDLAASRMIADYLAPWFRSGEFRPGIEASIEALVSWIKPQLAELGEEAEAQGSGGAGAEAGMDDLASAAGASEEPAADLAGLLVPQETPRQAREMEIRMMHGGLYLQQAELYDQAWRRASRPGSWTPGRLQEIARQWDRPFEVRVEGGRAIAFYRDAPALGPTFLRRERDGWIIDATATARSIVYDYSNDARYAIENDSPYLPLLRRELSLRKVRLQGGREAWMLAPG